MMPKPSDQHGGTDGKQRRKALTSYAQAGTYIGSGFQFAGAIVAGLFAGWWLDDKLSTTPIFVVAGTILGAIAGFYYLYRMLVQEPPSSADATEERRESADADPPEEVDS